MALFSDCLRAKIIQSGMNMDELCHETSIEPEDMKRFMLCSYSGDGKDLSTSDVDGICAYFELRLVEETKSFKLVLPEPSIPECEDAQEFARSWAEKYYGRPHIWGHPAPEPADASEPAPRARKKASASPRARRKKASGVPSRAHSRR